MYKLKGLQANPKLLTIAIPTYNRATHLDLCLSQICSQIKGYETLVDLIVSDNCSTDNTNEVVAKYIRDVFPITYFHNDENKGMDVNFLNCFNVANSKYIWLFSDDDVLLDSGLQKIIEILSSGDYGIVYMRPYAFDKDFLAEKPRNSPVGYDVYYSREAFLKIENYHFVYMTGNIVNKALVDINMEVNEFIGGCLVVMAWELSALANSKQNVHVRDVILGYKLDNSGGYAVGKVFGPNLDKILQYFNGRGFHYEDFSIIKKTLVFAFLPFIIRQVRLGKGGSYEKENFYENLYPVFSKYIGFWLFTYPMIRLPAWLMFVPFVIMRICNRPLLRLLGFFYERYNILVGNVKRCGYSGK
jgi:abequosyltransferase